MCISKIKIFLLAGFQILSSCWLFSQSEFEVLEYYPAPGQFINTAAGTPKAANELFENGTGIISLGAAGGFISLHAMEPVMNDPMNPYGVDFVIFGNAAAEFSEPGIVWVMKDENKNGKPDETWYQLAGSDYYFGTSRRNCQITYYENIENSKELFWKDDTGNEGRIEYNRFHGMAY